MKRYIEILQNLIPNLSNAEAEEIIKLRTNYKHDSTKEIIEQLKLYVKENYKGGK